MSGSVGVAAAQAVAWRALTDMAEVLEPRLVSSAARAKRSFHHHFAPFGWVEVLARDGRGPALAPTSDLGILLWTGILEEGGAETAAKSLLSPDLRSAAGVRTLWWRHPRFESDGYHTGAVWPFDNWFATGGLADVSPAAAASIAGSVLDVISAIDYVECFAVGDDGRVAPVSEATEVQAWSVGAALAWSSRWAGRTWTR